MTQFSSRLALVFGTRPEVLKLASVAKALAADWQVWLLNTGQQSGLTDMALKDAGIQAQSELGCVGDDRDLPGRLADLVTRLSDLFERERPAAVVVQGDTLSACAGALAAHYLQLPVVHVEAGLRSGRRDTPFPEETNRRLIAVLADLHLAPDRSAVDALIAEGIAESQIRRVGNPLHDLLGELDRRKTVHSADVLITMHRRESIAEGIANACRAVIRLANVYPQYRFLMLIHANPKVQAALRPLTDAGLQNILISEPLNHGDFIAALNGARLVMTDSGGVQEEAAFFDIPTLVLRDAADRVDGLDRPHFKLVGTEADRVFEAASALLQQNRPRKRAQVQRPGEVGARVAREISHFLTGAGDAKLASKPGRS